MHELLEKEQVQAEEKAVRYIAKAGDGSMRDALSLLDRCIAFYLGEELTYNKVLEVLGAVDVDIFSQLFCYVAKGNVIGCMEILEELVVRGRELGQVVSDFTWYLRNLLLVKTSEQAQDIIDVSTEHFAVMQEECELVEAETLMRYIRVMSELSNQIRYATQKRVLIEIALIKLCRPSMETNYDSLLDRVRVLENKMEQGIPVQMVETTTNAPSKPVSQPAKEETVEALQKAVPEDLQEVAKNWDRICGLLSGTLKALVREATPSVGEGNSLLLVFDNEVHCGMFESEGHIEELKNAIERQIQKEIVVRGKFVDQRTVQQDAMLDLTKLTKMPIDFED